MIEAINNRRAQTEARFSELTCGQGIWNYIVRGIKIIAKRKHMEIYVQLKEKMFKSESFKQELNMPNIWGTYKRW